MAESWEKVKHRKEKYMTKNKQIGIVFPLEVYKDIEASALLYNITVNEYIRQATYKALYGENKKI